MKVHVAVNSGFVQMFSNIIKDLDTNNEHQFIVYGKQMTGQVIDKKKLIDNFTIYDTLNEAKNKIEILVEKSTTIYIHFLSNEIIDVFNNLDLTNKKIVWYFWGADAFSMPEVYIKLKQYRTDYLRIALGKVKEIFVKKKSNQSKLDFLKKIDVVAHYSIDDFNLVKPMLKSSAVFQYFTYGVLDYVVNKNIELSGDDILLGNSASKNNNHIFSIYKILPKSVNKKIYCPLPYGSDNAYTNLVIQIGKKKFGDNFLPITDLIETSDYYKNILAKTSIAIMPHNRSQAWGNVMQLLWQGSKIYMFKDNSLYKFLKQKGFQVFELTKNRHKIFSNNSVDIEKNKELLLLYFSVQNLLPYYKQIISL